MGTKNSNIVDFERAFDNFIERREYDKAENALFSMIRISFNAGWLAAGGKSPEPQRIVELYRKPLEEIPSEDYIKTDIRLEKNS